MSSQMPKMNYYRLNNGNDLYDEFKNGMMSPKETSGFVRGAIYKYVFRYDKKGQRNSDLDKLVNYAIELRDLEWDHSQDNDSSDVQQNNEQANDVSENKEHE